MFCWGGAATAAKDAAPAGAGGEFYAAAAATPHPPPAGAPSAVHTPSVYPKGTCFAAHTGVPSRGRLTRTCPLMI